MVSPDQLMTTLGLPVRTLCTVVVMEWIWLEGLFFLLLSFPVLGAHSKRFFLFRFF
jgi:hypothetical protein